MAERKWYWAALLTLLQPGLGHMYAGRLGRGVALWAAVAALGAGMAAAGLPGTFRGLAAFTAVTVAATLAVLADAVLLCRPGRFVPRPYNHWKWYLAAFFAWYVAGSVISYTGSFGANHLRAFRVPTASMAPTLVPGDHIYADSSAYASRAPQRGDIVVVRPPVDPNVAYVKRVAAVPGDTVNASPDAVRVNGRAVRLPGHGQAAPTGGGAGTGSGANSGRAGRDGADAPEAVGGQGLSGEKQWTLGPDEFFVLGDNIAHSQDSRHFGPVNRRDILGRALYIYYSQDFDRIGADLR